MTSINCEKYAINSYLGFLVEIWLTLKLSFQLTSHQMDNLESQMRALIRLALMDQNFADVEKKLIMKLGKANGLEENQIEDIIKSEFSRDASTKFEIEFSALTYDQRFEYLYNLVHLMKADKKVFLSEIKFCEEIAAKLRFIPDAVETLSKRIFSDPSITVDRDHLKLELKKFDFS